MSEHRWQQNAHFHKLLEQNAEQRQMLQLNKKFQKYENAQQMLQSKHEDTERRLQQQTQLFSQYLKHVNLRKRSSETLENQLPLLQSLAAPAKHDGAKDFLALQHYVEQQKLLQLQNEKVNELYQQREMAEQRKLATAKELCRQQQEQLIDLKCQQSKLLSEKTELAEKYAEIEAKLAAFVMSESDNHKTIQTIIDGIKSHLQEQQLMDVFALKHLQIYTEQTQQIKKNMRE